MFFIGRGWQVLIIVLTIPLSACSKFTSIFNSQLTASALLGKGDKARLGDGARTVAFINQCSEPVWFGINGGAIGHGNHAPNCPDGSISKGDTDCYSINPVPANKNYRLEPHGGTNTVTIPKTISHGVTDRIDIQWTGNMAARMKCSNTPDATGKYCAIGDCGSDGKFGPDGIPGCSTGIIQPSTMAEFTIQPTVDFYDVTNVNGVSVPTQVTPVNDSGFLFGQDPSQANNPYWCTSPGAVVPTVVDPALPTLGACNWKLNPPSIEYKNVSYEGTPLAPPQKCRQDSDCQGSLVCGMSFAPGIDVHRAFQLTCGKFEGYLNADQICSTSLNGYGDPANGYTQSSFNCSEQVGLGMFGALAAAQPPFLNSGYSSRVLDDNQVSGCINWNDPMNTRKTIQNPIDASIALQYFDPLQVPGANSTTQCSSSNPRWWNKVLPTIYWEKKACPTAYVYPFDDPSSTFKCALSNSENVNTVDYVITFCPEGVDPFQH